MTRRSKRADATDRTSRAKRADYEYLLILRRHEWMGVFAVSGSLTKVDLKKKIKLNRLP